jgi:hypothetical protein
MLLTVYVCDARCHTGGTVLTLSGFNLGVVLRTSTWAVSEAMSFVNVDGRPCTNVKVVGASISREATLTCSAPPGAGSFQDVMAHIAYTDTYVAGGIASSSSFSSSSSSAAFSSSCSVSIPSRGFVSASVRACCCLRARACGSALCGHAVLTMISPGLFVDRSKRVVKPMYQFAQLQGAVAYQQPTVVAISPSTGSPAGGYPAVASIANLGPAYVHVPAFHGDHTH